MSLQYRYLFISSILFALSLIGAPLFAQNIAEPDSSHEWLIEMVMKINASQVGFSNGQGGGVNAMALGGGIDITVDKEASI